MKISKLEKIEEGRYSVVSPSCAGCGSVKIIEVDSDWVFRMNQGGSVSELMPLTQYSLDIRERFISGTCPTCWEAMFGSLEEEMA